MHKYFEAYIHSLFLAVAADRYFYGLTVRTHFVDCQIISLKFCKRFVKGEDQDSLATKGDPAHVMTKPEKRFVLG